jgi:hypothetical protein
VRKLDFLVTRGNRSVRRKRGNLALRKMAGVEPEFCVGLVQLLSKLTLLERVLKRAAFAMVMTSSFAQAAPVLLNNQPMDPPLETRADLDAGLTDVLDERIPLATLERFGVSVQTSSLDARVRLRVTERVGNLEWLPERGWVLLPDAAPLSPPVLKDNATYVPLRVLTMLGFEASANELGINLIPRLPELETLPVGGLNQLLEFKLTRARPTQLQLNFAKAPNFSVLEQTFTKLRVQFTGAATAMRFQPVGYENFSRVRLLRAGFDTVLEAEVPTGTRLEFAALDQQWTLTATQLATTAPKPGPTPAGVKYSVIPSGLTKLHFIQFDPTKYAPKVVAAPWGGGRNLLEFAQGAQGGPSGIAAINAGYFDPSTMQAVDLLFDGGLQAYARGNRATLGFLESGAIWGTPRARLTLNLGSQALNINAIRPAPHPQFVTFFVGDGFVPVGGLGFTTYVLDQGKILERRFESFVPLPGQQTITFNPRANPTLERQIGEAASVALAWNETAWSGVQTAIAAGPRLVTNGAFSVNPQLEGFDTKTEIWRPTRQVGIGVDNLGQYFIAMLELGTPEMFAEALVKAGARDAMRLDSGSSAQIALAGGAVGGKWGRAVPNAIVFYPK